MITIIPVANDPEIRNCTSDILYLVCHRPRERLVGRL